MGEVDVAGRWQERIIRSCVRSSSEKEACSVLNIFGSPAVFFSKNVGKTPPQCAGKGRFLDAAFCRFGTLRCGLRSHDDDQIIAELSGDIRLPVDCAVLQTAARNQCDKVISTPDSQISFIQGLEQKWNSPKLPPSGGRELNYGTVRSVSTPLLSLSGCLILILL